MREDQGSTGVLSGTRFNGVVSSLTKVLSCRCTCQTKRALKARWRRPGVAWKRRSALDRFATLRVYRRRSSEPLQANGRERCSREELSRWAKEKWRFSPYQYKLNNLVKEQGVCCSLDAGEREQLRDFPLRHTVTALNTRARKEQPGLLEATRCALL